MAQYSHFRRTGTNLKTAGVSPQVAWYGIATMIQYDKDNTYKFKQCCKFFTFIAVVRR